MEKGLRNEGHQLRESSNRNTTMYLHQLKEVIQNNFSFHECLPSSLLACLLPINLWTQIYDHNSDLDVVANTFLQSSPQKSSTHHLYEIQTCMSHYRLQPNIRSTRLHHFTTNVTMVISNHYHLTSKEAFKIRTPFFQKHARSLHCSSPFPPQKK